MGSKMIRLKIKNKCFLIFTLLFLIGSVFIVSIDAQSGSVVGLWHFDEIFPDGYQIITPDATGQNSGVLIDSPELVEGKFGKALLFDGNNAVYIPIRFLVGFPPTPEPIYIPISTSLDVSEEIKIEAWINMQAFKDVAYGNIVSKCTRYDDSYENATRVYGIAIKSDIQENGVAIQKGALSGYVHTDIDGYNEIVTTESVVPLNKWVHVSFVRTLSTGMHLYVNGYEKDVIALSGVQNPQGKIIDGTEVYFGHDANVIIDEIRITNLSPESLLLSQIDIGPNLFITIIVVTIVFAIAWVLRRAIQMWTIRSRP
jgi:hypothetical protein